MLSFVCPRCHKTLTAPEAKAGKKGRCPSCREPVVVPGIASDVDEGGHALIPLSSSASLPAISFGSEPLPAAHAETALVSSQNLEASIKQIGEEHQPHPALSVEKTQEKTAAEKSEADPSAKEGTAAAEKAEKYPPAEEQISAPPVLKFHPIIKETPASHAEYLPPGSSLPARSAAGPLSIPAEKPGSLAPVQPSTSLEERSAYFAPGGYTAADPRAAPFQSPELRQRLQNLEPLQLLPAPLPASLESSRRSTPIRLGPPEKQAIEPEPEPKA
jgi:DNA-directed RNA polymerase subunit RPC12/RpoP